MWDNILYFRMIKLYFYIKYDDVSSKINFSEIAAISFRVINEITASYWNMFESVTTHVYQFKLESYPTQIQEMLSIIADPCETT